MKAWNSDASSRSLGLTVFSTRNFQAGQESRGISAQPGDTFAVTNADGRLLYEHVMPVKHTRSDTQQGAMRLVNLHCELQSAMNLMNMLDKLSGDLLQDLTYLEMQLTRSNEKALESIQQEQDLDLISAVRSIVSMPNVSKGCLAPHTRMRLTRESRFRARMSSSWTAMTSKATAP